MSGLLDREAYEWTKQDSTVLPIPAKTALIGLIIFFDSIIHPVFIRMLMCCLIHPLTATSIKEDIVVPTPKLLTVDAAGKVCVRLEDSDSRDENHSYEFGRSCSGVSSSPHEDSSCFVLAPPIIDLIESKYSAIKVRPNPYRKIILNGLRGVYEDDRIQPFFAMLLNAMISKQEKSFISLAFVDVETKTSLNTETEEVVEEETDSSIDSFHTTTDEAYESEDSLPQRFKVQSDALKEVIESLCSCVISAPLMIGGKSSCCRRIFIFD